MSETTVAAPKKKGGGGKTKKSSAAVNHPKVAEMVCCAIGTLKERNGSSLQAVKKYIASAYKVDVEKMAPFIRRYLKSAVVNGKLIQTKGKGASGSFKLGGKGDGGNAAAKTGSTKKAKPAAPKKAEGAAKPKKSSPKKKTSKPKSPKKVSKAKAKRSPMKAKTPKPKKVAAKSAKGKSSSAPKQSTTA